MAGRVGRRSPLSQQFPDWVRQAVRSRGLLVVAQRPNGLVLCAAGAFGLRPLPVAVADVTGTCCYRSLVWIAGRSASAYLVETSVAVTRLVVLVTSGAFVCAGALLRRLDSTAVPGPEQLHLHFGPDAATQMVVSWATPAPAARPPVRLGTPGDGRGTTIEAVERAYVEAITGQPVWTYHAVLDGLEPDTHHVHEVLHDGSSPIGGRFRTGPVGRSPFRFTSFGDLSIRARECRPRPRVDLPLTP